MSQRARLVAAYPIGGELLDTLPVCALPSAIDFYTRTLGFRAESIEASTARFSRDDIKLGVVVDREHEPSRAGSVAIEVDNLDVLHDELTQSGAAPGVFDVQAWSSRKHRTFFVREDNNGYCYCFFAMIRD